ncbi:MAG: copper resistance protein CopC [Methylocystis sp.]|nr:copper resistance protein CopC [Methylocystis sp.]
MRAILTKAVTTLAIASAVGAMAPVPAQSHTFLLDSLPAAKSHITTPIDAVKLHFGGRVDARYSTIHLKNENGDILASGTQPQLSREFALPVPPLSPGRYHVNFRVLSTDGDIVQGGFVFVVDG